MYWIDLAIIVMVIVGLVQGFFRGFVAQVFQIISLIIAAIVAFWTFPYVGDWFETQIQVPLSFARPVALAIIFFTLAFILQTLATITQKLIAPILTANPLNRGVGSILGGVRQLVNASIILALLVTLPLPTTVKASVETSTLAKPLIGFALGLERSIRSVFHDDSLKSLGYRIVGTDEQTTTSLNFTVDNPSIDAESEAQMVLLTNAVRAKEGKKPLPTNEQLRDVARAHARDMLARGYFAHVSPQGKDALARLQDAGITVLAVGENLATAPNVEIAQGGLMASEGHRKNILSEEFNQVGIGILDAGKHGKIIVQLFGKMF